MAEQEDSGRHVRRAQGSLWALLPFILLVELVLDILGLPLDEFLIPLEAVFDVGFLLVAAVSSMGGGSGRPIGSGRPGLRRGRRGLARVSGLGLAIYWVFVVGLFGFQLWFAGQHPILTLFLGVFEFLFDAFLVMIGFLLTIAAIAGARAESGREIGAGQR